MLQNKKSQTLIMQSDVIRCAVCISNTIEYLDKTDSRKNSTKEVNYIAISSDRCNVIENLYCMGKISCHRSLQIQNELRPLYKNLFLVR